MFIYSEAKHEVQEWDLDDQFIKNRFNKQYNFINDSLEDIPEEEGIRMWVDSAGKFMIASANREHLLCAVVGLQLEREDPQPAKM